MSHSEEELMQALKDVEDNPYNDRAWDKVIAGITELIQLRQHVAVCGCAEKQKELEEQHEKIEQLEAKLAEAQGTIAAMRQRLLDAANQYQTLEYEELRGERDALEDIIADLKRQLVDVQRALTAAREQLDEALKAEARALEQLAEVQAESEGWRKVLFEKEVELRKEFWRAERAEAKLAEAEEKTKRIIQHAVGMLSSGVCEEHSKQINGWPFSEFVEAEKALGCPYCNKAKLGATEVAIRNLQSTLEQADAKLSEVQAEAGELRALLDDAVESDFTDHAPTCLGGSDCECGFNGWLDKMENALSLPHASAYAERVQALEAVARAAAEVRLHDWYRTSICLKDALAKLKEMPNGNL